LRANLQLQNEIKERKKAEETVELCEERLSTVAEITGDWLWEADADLRLTYVNLGVVELLGFEQSEILNRTPWDLTPDSETDRMEKRFREILDSRQAFRDLENLIVHKDGHIVALEFSGLPFFDALGQLYGYRGIIRNVSDRKS
jgi:PAS domain S-box-containing protein